MDYFESQIGIKADHMLNRNFYKGIAVDNINIILAAAAFNFKRMMNNRKSSLLSSFGKQFLVLKLFYLSFLKQKLVTLSF